MGTVERQSQQEIVGTEGHSRESAIREGPGGKRSAGEGPRGGRREGRTGC